MELNLSLIAVRYKTSNSVAKVLYRKVLIKRCSAILGISFRKHAQQEPLSMPTLYKYTENSNSGTGYFVRAGVDGSVITLQTNRIAEELYDELEYTAATIPEGGGDELPSRLVWSLYKVGLHHTEKQGVDTDREALLNSLQGEIQLKSDEVDKLRKFIKENLSRNEKLSEVAKHFDIDVEKEGGIETGEEEKEEKVESLKKIYKKITGEGDTEEKDKTPDLPKDVEDALSEWQLSDPDKIRSSISDSEELQQAVRQMSNHEWEVKKVEYNEYKYKERTRNGEIIEYEASGIIHHISTESIERSCEYSLRQRNGNVGVTVLDPRTVNKIDLQIEEDDTVGQTDFIIELLSPQLNDTMGLAIEDGHILGNPLSDMEDDTTNRANHRRLGYLSLLYNVAEEFVELLEGYELADPYSEKMEGTVTFFHGMKGYGFIERDGASESDDDVFFHMEEIGGPNLEEGTRLRFEVTEGEKGPRAENVERI